jgi:uncharacterized SAM-binding protein YcdF (DUF218 family)
MYILKKLITAAIFPPGIFILVMLGAGTLLLKFRRRWTGSGLLVLGLIMWALSISPVTDLLLAGLIRDLPSGGSLPRGDVIVLLGGGVDDRLTDLSGKPGILPETMVDRLVTAVRLAARLQVPVIVSGGRAPGGQVAEADTARRYMLDLGVPAEAILTEGASTDTFENAENVRETCRRHGFTRPILVTSDYHLKRALWSFEKVGLSCRPFANGLAARLAKAYRWENFLPGSFDAAARYLHEYVGLVYYRLVY